MLVTSRTRNRTAAVVLAAALTLSATGCRSPDRNAAADSFETSAASTDRVVLSGIHDATISGKPGPASVSDLQQISDSMQQMADRLGLAAVMLQPDDQLEQYFLIVAPTQADAQAFNGLFYWFWTSQADLVLCIDRLFTQTNRKQATRDRTWTEQGVVDLLDLSLQQVLGQRYDTDYLAFILDSYREEFDLKQDSAEQQAFHRKQVIGSIEVSYESNIFSTVTFSSTQP